MEIENIGRGNLTNPGLYGKKSLKQSLCVGGTA